MKLKLQKFIILTEIADVHVQQPANTMMIFKQLITGAALLILYGSSSSYIVMTTNTDNTEMFTDLVLVTLAGADQVHIQQYNNNRIKLYGGNTVGRWNWKRNQYLAVFNFIWLGAQYRPTMPHRHGISLYAKLMNKTQRLQGRAPRSL